ncbi:DDB1- and CUL4-associated factor 4 isoform X1 [Python bivittatus]|uniref:DDB1- and CUL4-associated factor 4 isoform X1 n=1 Tax=Python bivittatus TaxID=176946 RepID=A0A9F2NCE5_PYTBI|nr:DDB1- and CUL4-associated factor 4 isoform X1 [Python bivittatus]XP_007428152.1 DDB1- and CUL4-associated factor 4 isoform X1 [Python bivittatus]XP_007428153.1 DDB1- and CUL4-associated factor 4 isoform X1 [Python bivittatus]XP_007428154.1 DDB1- and CUL4-associated factor 4 isoform X1 [Python bivittatus]XP_007428155.2 DDB1- and CUL4-associated factor 4 isoform X2 [Python bivittatus]XP_025022356.1 DDB1- and CUL4-associated factor 4 isoform X1 [Python bivittatus]XP_025022357.1 DDB1- and CUL4
MKRNRWQGRGNHVQHNRRQICNTQPYTVCHHRHSTERPEQRELQSLQNSGTSQTESPSTSSHSCQSSSVPELPGFYYDPEKNRYFRLLPGHNNCNPLTKESIHQKEMESQRLRLLKEEEKMMKKTPRSGLNSSVILRKKQLGFYSSISYCRLIHELKVNCMQRRKLEIESLSSSVSGSNNFKLIVADTASERIITVNDVERGGCKYGIVNLSGLGKDSLTVEMYDNLYFTNRKVNSVCWASLSHLDSHVLLCLMGAAETLGCASLLPASLFNSSNAGDQPGMLCSFKISTAWSCAWCHNPQANNCFSTGLSQRILVTNAVTGHHQTFNTNSDVLAQQFATQSPVLYNGCRSGEIFSIDVRQRSHKGQGWKATQLFHDSAVTSVNLLKTEQYLMAADMLGQVKLWDLRKLKCVKEYRGHKNEHTIVPLHINETEGLLSAVGQDCYTRIWSLRDAHLLRTIPSPYPSSRDSIPSVVFSSQLGGVRGVPGLLMAVRQDLYYFSYKTDDPYCLHTKDMDCSTLYSE